uniref:C2 domain-containing protein n=1 Tax=Chromera velia CCMP2878 TaxID=1169474 RepID=A0A0G4FFU6_9ALVE|eukprot:Cvel_16753.t1-p1 / transcript=Cvel_16753.t1 / gene=Cvel_16753 / organism=Chromera_velia_CCMP2878 / gene_product=hypothetical protein / transcript_product=hypothetical protein / location=Cvel_scaffold1305:25885-46579(+) / protein_length=3270 / sequence_SO=supercontig / SO=protein_coding / is_pseudo=false
MPGSRKLEFQYAGKKRRVEAGWLSSVRDEEEYRRLVKISMMIAASKRKIQKMKEALKDKSMHPGGLEREIESEEQYLDSLVRGRVEVAVSFVPFGPLPGFEPAKANVLYKAGRGPFSGMVRRYFEIFEGRLTSFRKDPSSGAQPPNEMGERRASLTRHDSIGSQASTGSEHGESTKVYDLRGLNFSESVSVEDRESEPGVNRTEKWQKDPAGGLYRYRVVLQTPARQHGALFLYTQDLLAAHLWAHSIRVSQHMSSARRLDLLTRALQKIASAGGEEGFQVLAEEMVAERARRPDYVSRREARRGSKSTAPAEGADEAAGVLFSRMKALRGLQDALSDADVKSRVLESLQAKFRRFKQARVEKREWEALMDTLSPVSHLKKGQQLDVAYSCFNEANALNLLFGEVVATQLFLSNPPADFPAYSPVDFAEARTTNVACSQDFQLLSFGGGGERESGVTAVRSFIQMASISSVILNSAPPLSGSPKGFWLSVLGQRLRQSRAGDCGKLTLILEDIVERLWVKKTGEIRPPLQALRLGVLNALTSSDLRPTHTLQEDQLFVDSVRGQIDGTSIVSFRVYTTDTNYEAINAALDNKDKLLSDIREGMQDALAEVEMEARDLPLVRQINTTSATLRPLRISEVERAAVVRMSVRARAVVPSQFLSQLSADTPVMLCMTLMGEEFISETTTAGSAGGSGLEIQLNACVAVPVGGNSRRDATVRAWGELTSGVEMGCRICSVTQVATPDSMASPQNDQSRETLLYASQPVSALGVPSPTESVKAFDLKFRSWSDLAAGGRGGSEGRVVIEAVMKLEDAKNLEHRQVSPDYLGRGSPGATHTSHAIAYLNDFGSGNSQVVREVGLEGSANGEEVPNYLQINLDSLFFPLGNDGKGNEKLLYFVTCRAGSAVVSSDARHRLTSSMAGSKGGDAPPLPRRGSHGRRSSRDGPVGSSGAAGPTQVLPFCSKLFLELPPHPGMFKSVDGKKTVEVALWEMPRPDVCDFGEMDKKAKYGEPKRLGRALVNIGSLSLNEAGSETRLLFLPDSYYSEKLSALEWSRLQARAQKAGEDRSSCALTLSLCLRDQLWVMAHSSDGRGADGDGVHSSLSQRRFLVGSKLLLMVEQPQRYPVDARAWRRRALPTGPDPEAKDKPPRQWSEKDRKANEGKLWKAPLREPATSWELRQSGIDAPLKVQLIPDYCEDVIPHKFVLAASQHDHEARHCPGFWHKIFEEGDSSGGKLHPGKVVTHVSSLCRWEPVKLIAVYGNFTCDVAISTDLAERLFNEARSARAKGLQPQLPGYLDYYKRIVRRVHVSMLRSMYEAGFHIYDASYRSTDDATQNQFAKTRIPPKEPACFAGPLPFDANPTLVPYEWQMDIRFETEKQMIAFARHLNLGAQQAHFDELIRLRRKRAEDAQSGAMRLYRRLWKERSLAALAGKVEVVVVEVLNVSRKPADRRDSADGQAQLPWPSNGSSGGNQEKKVNASVTFRLKFSGDPPPEDYAAATNFQRTPVIPQSSHPRFSLVSALKAAGGYTFRTREIIPVNFLVFEVCLWHSQETRTARGGGTGTPEKAVLIGCAELPAHELIHAKRPFCNLWEPLTPYGTGELHLLTRFLPSDPALASLPVHKPQSAKAFIDMQTASSTITDAFGLPVRKGQFDPSLMNANRKVYELLHAKAPADQIARAVAQALADPSQLPRPRHKFESGQKERELHVSAYLHCLVFKARVAWEKATGGRFIQWTDPNLPIDEGAKREILQMASQPRSGRGDSLLEAASKGFPPEARPRLWRILSGAEDIRQNGTFAKCLQAAEGVESAVLRQLVEDLERVQSEEETFLWGGAGEAPAGADAAQNLRQARALQLSALILRARDACTAFVMYNSPDSSGGRRASRSSQHPMRYSPTLPRLALRLLIPQPDPLAGTFFALSSEDVFWILVALGGSQGPLSGLLSGAETGGNSDADSVAVRGGPGFAECILLESVLAVLFADVLSRTRAVGYPLSDFFGPSFASLFAGVLPSHSFFLFFDYLMACQHETPGRSREVLVSLAVALISTAETDLKNAHSAAGARAALVSAADALQDPNKTGAYLNWIETEVWEKPQNKGAVEDIAEFAFRGLESILPSIQNENFNLRGLGAELSGGETVTPGMIANKAGALVGGEGPSGFVRSLEGEFVPSEPVDSRGRRQQSVRETAPVAFFTARKFPKKLFPSAEEVGSVVKKELPQLSQGAAAACNVLAATSPEGGGGVVSWHDFLASAVLASSGTTREKAKALFKLFAESLPEGWGGAGSNNESTQAWAHTAASTSGGDALSKTSKALVFEVKHKRGTVGKAVVSSLSDCLGAVSRRKVLSVFSGRRQTGVMSVDLAFLPDGGQNFPPPSDLKGQGSVKGLLSVLIDRVELDEEMQGRGSVEVSCVSEGDKTAVAVKDYKLLPLREDGTLSSERDRDRDSKEELPPSRVYGGARNETQRQYVHIRTDALLPTPSDSTGSRSSLISLLGCRRVTQTILRRALVPLSARALCTVSDVTFSRYASAPTLVSAVFKGSGKTADATSAVVKGWEASFASKGFDSSFDAGGGALFRDAPPDSVPNWAHEIELQLAGASGTESKKVVVALSNGRTVDKGPGVVKLDEAVNGLSHLSAADFEAALCCSGLLSGALVRAGSALSKGMSTRKCAPFKCEVFMPPPPEAEEIEEREEEGELPYRVLLEVWNTDPASVAEPRVPVLLGEAWLPPFCSIPSSFPQRLNLKLKDATDATDNSSAEWGLRKTQSPLIVKESKGTASLTVGVRLEMPAMSSSHPPHRLRYKGSKLCRLHLHLMEASGLPLLHNDSSKGRSSSTVSPPSAFVRVWVQTGRGRWTPGRSLWTPEDGSLREGRLVEIRLQQRRPSTSPSWDETVCVDIPLEGGGGAGGSMVGSVVGSVYSSAVGTGIGQGTAVGGGGGRRGSRGGGGGRESEIGTQVASDRWSKQVRVSFGGQGQPQVGGWESVRQVVRLACDQTRRRAETEKNQQFPNLKEDDGVIALLLLPPEGKALSANPPSPEFLKHFAVERHWIPLDLSDPLETAVTRTLASHGASPPSSGGDVIIRVVQASPLLARKNPNVALYLARKRMERSAPVVERNSVEECFAYVFVGAQEGRVAWKPALVQQLDRAQMIAMKKEADRENEDRLRKGGGGSWVMPAQFKGVLLQTEKKIAVTKPLKASEIVFARAPAKVDDALGVQAFRDDPLLAGFPEQIVNLRAAGVNVRSIARLMNKKARENWQKSAKGDPSRKPVFITLLMVEDVLKRAG